MSVQDYLFAFGVVFVSTFFISIVLTRRIIKNELSEKIKLDISSDQMMESEERIKQFFKEHNINTDTSISKIANILKVEKGGVEKELEEQANLKEENGKKIVVFKGGLTEQEKQFVFAHEIAHLINGDEVPVTRPSGRNKSQTEQLADYTAAALLMPLENVYSFLETNNYIGASTKKRTIMVKHLCKKYGVTEVIALRRVKEVYVLKQSTTKC